MIQSTRGMDSRPKAELAVKLQSSLNIFESLVNPIYKVVDRSLDRVA